jgi:hypothetical protein
MYTYTHSLTHTAFDLFCTEFAVPLPTVLLYADDFLPKWFGGMRGHNSRMR